MVIYNASVFVALLISYLELFALPTKADYVTHVASADEEIERRSAYRGSQSSRSLLGQGGSRAHGSRQVDDEEATESTSLLRGNDRQSKNTFTRLTKQRHPDTDGTLEDVEDPYLTKAYGDEQAWSSSLPRWTWIVQFLIVAPINIIVVGQIALLLTYALDQYVCLECIVTAKTKLS